MIISTCFRLCCLIKDTLIAQYFNTLSAMINVYKDMLLSSLQYEEYSGVKLVFFTCCNDEKQKITLYFSYSKPTLKNV